MICPRTNDALSAFISARASAVTWSPVEVLAVHLEVVLCDSSTSSTNHRFKTLQYLMYGRTSDSVETSTYLLSCEACTEGNGYFFFSAYFQTPIGRILVYTLSNFRQRGIVSRAPQVNGKMEETTARFHFKKKSKGNLTFSSFFPFSFCSQKHLPNFANAVG